MVLNDPWPIKRALRFSVLSALTGRLRWQRHQVLLALGGVVALFAVLLLMWCAHLWDRRAEVWQQESVALRARLSSIPAPLLPPRDFVMRLPSSPRVESFLDDARRWGADGNKGLGIQVVSANIRAAASEGRLTYADVQLEVRGHYPALKDWVNELQGRYREAAVTAMDLRASPEEEGALGGSLQWRLYARGVDVPAASHASAAGTAP